MLPRLIAVGDCHFKFISGVDKKWQEDRYRNFIDDLVFKCSEEEAILILAGDILDSTTPKKEEVQMFLYLMHELNMAGIITLLVSGNHETLRAGSSILDYLEVTKFMNVVYRKPYTLGDTTFHLVNHDSINSYVPKLNKHNILVSHFRCNYNKFVTEEIDVAKFTEPYDLCIVGDIHDSFSFGKVHYTNNPVNKEFDTNPNCGYLEIRQKLTGFDVTRIPTNYPALMYRKLTVKEYNKMLGHSGEDFYKIEVTGTPEELRSVIPKLHNTILHKIPIVPAALLPKDTEVVISDTSGEEGLIGYMKSLDYKEGLIANMMSELRRGDE